MSCVASNPVGQRNLRLLAFWLAGLFLTIGVGCESQPVPPSVALESPAGLAVAGSDGDRLFIASRSLGAIHVLELGEGLDALNFVESAMLYFPLQLPVGIAPSDVAASDSGEVVAVLDWARQSIHVIDADLLSIADLRRLECDDTNGVCTALGDDDDGSWLTAVDLNDWPGEGPTGASGAVSAAPSHIVSRPGACGEHCVAEFAVSLAGSGSIAFLRIFNRDSQDDSAAGVAGFDFDLTAVGTGGHPSALAFSPDGRFVFAIDAASNEVIRLEMVGGTVTESHERRALGAPGGPLAVSADGQMLLVGRPSQQDVLVFGGAAATGDEVSDFAVLDANTEYAPVPECVPVCDVVVSASSTGDENKNICNPRLLANMNTCISADGLAVSSDAVAYKGIYLGETPSVILPLSSSAAATGVGRLQVDCMTDDGDRQVGAIDDYALVATIDGSIRFVSLSTLQPVEGVSGTEEDLNEPVADALPALVSHAWCNDSRVFAADSAAGPLLNELLTSCPPDLPDRRNLHCYSEPAGSADSSKDTDSESAGDGVDALSDRVVFWRGHGGRRLVSLSWEGPVHPSLVRGLGGEITPDGSFYDLFQDIGIYDDKIRPGDILEVLTPPDTTDPDCQAELDEAGIIFEAGDDLCIFERRIAALQIEERRGTKATILALNPLREGQLSLPPSCFPRRGLVRYTIRPFRQFTVAVTNAVTQFTDNYRLSPGGRFGPGGETANDVGLSFAIREPQQVGDSNPASAWDGCRHRAAPLGDGAIIGRAAAAYERGVSLTFGINDHLAAPDNDFRNGDDMMFVRSGLNLDFNGLSKSPAGRLPGDLVVGNIGFGDDAAITAVVSYGTSNALLFLDPTDGTAGRFDSAAYRVLR